MGIDNPMTSGDYYPGGRSHRKYIEDCKTLIRKKQRELERLQEKHYDAERSGDDEEVSSIEMQMYELECEISDLEEEIK